MPDVNLSQIADHTKCMPYVLAALIFYGITSIIICLMWPKSPVHAGDEISIYYLRYDIQSINHKLTDEKLTMIPAENDFRAENFSHHLFSGSLSPRPGESTLTFKKRIRERVLKSVLKDKGLKSVYTVNYNTIVSYEGMVKAPIPLRVKKGDRQRVEFTADIYFSPLAFPDRWKALETKSRIDQTVHDILQLFQ